MGEAQRPYWAIMKPFGIQDVDSFATIDFREDPEKGIVASVFLYAPGKGDEFLDVVGKAMQEHADRIKKPVTHVARPENTASFRLFSRRADYEAVPDSDYPTPPFVKTFVPNGKQLAFAGIK